MSLESDSNHGYFTRSKRVCDRARKKYKASNCVKSSSGLKVVDLNESKKRQD